MLYTPFSRWNNKKRLIFQPSDTIDDVDDHDDDIASSIQPYAFEPMVDTSDITTNIGRGGGGRGE